MTTTDPRPDVKDWTTDFDTLAPGYVAAHGPRVGRSAWSSATYFKAKLDEREKVSQRARPDDLITMLVEVRHDGDPLDDPRRIGSCFLLLLAGIDTTWISIGSELADPAAVTWSCGQVRGPRSVPVRW